MAELLYRLGRWSARRAWVVIAGWLAALMVAGGSYLAFGGTLADSFTLPDTPTSQVNDLLAEKMGSSTGAAGTVVFSGADGQALSADQAEQISAVLAEVADLDGVATVVDPFATTAEREQQAAQLAEGRAQLEAGQAELDAGREQLETARAQAEAGLAQLETAQTQLDVARAQLETMAAQVGAGAVAPQLAALDAQQAQLDAGREQAEAGMAQVEAGMAQLETGQAELDAQTPLLDAGERLLDYATEVRTVSADGTTARAVVMFTDYLFTLDEAQRTAVVDVLDAAEIPGVQVDYSGEFTASVEGIVGAGEVTGVLIAAMVLVAMLGALLPAAVPLVSAVTGVGVGIAGAMAFSGVVEMVSVTPVLGLMLGLAVGIDYSLFILNRHRRQLLHGTELFDSVGLATGTSGNAVVFAGTTVFIALLALAVPGIPFLTVMGVVGAAAVLVSVLVAVTLTPALLGLLGPRVLSRRARARIGAPEHAAAPPRAMRTPRILAAATVATVGLLVVAAPALSMRLGLPDGASEPPGSTEHRAYTAVAESFGPGATGTLLVAVTLADPADETDVLTTQADLAGELMAVDDVVAVVPVGVSPDRDLMTFQVQPAEGPSSESTEQLVHTLRAMTPAEAATELGVAGQTSAAIDISDALGDALPVYLVVVVGLSLLILTVVFRSLLVPVIATAGFVLSLFAALGAITAVYQWGWLGGLFDVTNPGPILSFAPIIITGVLFGLAMDYQLFLVSGMREAYVHGTPAREAVVAGLRNGRAVVTAAAIIMTSVFGGFMFSGLSMVRPLGFGLAIGVALDAFVVRMVLIPAAMHVFGDRAWWLPRWLDRLLPQADVEGARLERRHPGHLAAEPVAATVGQATP